MTVAERQNRNIAAGLCASCSQRREHYKRLCDRCAVRHRRNLRRYQGTQPWRPGSAGRRPFVQEVAE